jgi:Predicted acyltransferase
MNGYELQIKRFSELTAKELYEILRLRSAVFVVEQNCVYQDLDGLDEGAVQLFLRRADGSCAACARVHEKPDEPGVFRIGRIVSAERGRGLGMRILLAAVEECRRLGAREIYIEAQEYAIGFYEKAGFAVTSGVFLEDGIPHVEMRLGL